MLDEIINYIQSLQRQVEVKKKTLLPLCYKVVNIDIFLCIQFLSMKLEVVNSGPSTGPTIGVFPTGDVSYDFD